MRPKSCQATRVEIRYIHTILLHRYFLFGPSQRFCILQLVQQLDGTASATVALHGTGCGIAFSAAAFELKHGWLRLADITERRSV